MANRVKVVQVDQHPHQVHHFGQDGFARGGGFACASLVVCALVGVWQLGGPGARWRLGRDGCTAGQRDRETEGCRDGRRHALQQTNNCSLMDNTMPTRRLMP